MSASGRLIVLSGPSGVGKTTVGRSLLKSRRRLIRSISATTRPRRKGEREGRDYRFLTPQAFAALLARNGFLEHADVYGRFYGTPKAPVLKALKSGRDVLLVIDVQGAAQVKRSFPEAVLVFLSPPSWKELVRRLKGRGTEDATALKRRLATARREMAQARRYDAVVVNDRVPSAVRRILALLDPGQGAGPPV